MNIRLENIKIGYSSQSVLLSANNLNINQGELVTLIGLNGSGKSTLIKTICGMIHPISGHVFILNNDVIKLSAANLSEFIGLVTTERINLPSITVFDLVSLGRIPYSSIYGQLQESDLNIINEALSATEISHLTWKLFDELSDGEKQRVMIARALAQDTPILLMDEPTAFLDAFQRKKMMELLKDIKTKFSKSILISTHEIDLALAYSDQMWIIENNLIHSISDSHEMKSKLNSLFNL